MRKKSIRSKIRKSILVMASLVALTASISAFVISKEYIEKRFFAEIETMITASESLLDALFNNANQSLMGLKDHLESHIQEEDLTDEELQHYIMLTKSGIPSATTLYFGTEDKRFIMWPIRYLDDSFDPRVRSWYLLAKGEPNTIKWGAPYQDIGTGELVLTGSYFLNWEGNPNNGVLGVDILLNDVKELMGKFSAGQTGEIMLVSRDDRILISNEESNLLEPLANLNPSLVNLKVGELFSDFEYTYYRRNLKNESYYFVGRVANSELHLLSLMLLLSIAGISSIMAILVMVLSDRFAKHLTAPIIDLTKTVREVQQGRFDIQCTSQSDDEVGDLIDGYNQMLVTFNEHHLELTALYEELYASEETLKAQYEEIYDSRELIRESELRYRDVFEASKEGLWALDNDGTYTLYSTDWYKLYDMDIETPSLDAWRALIHPEDKGRVQSALDHHVRFLTDNYNCEFRVKDLNGEYHWIQSRGKASFNAEGAWTRLVGSHVDITSRKETEAHIRQLAYKDSLTDLGNRFALQEFLEREISSKHMGTILFIDIDNFKYINDTFGHPIGDLVLKETAKRLVPFVSNELQLARFSGDEYLMVLCGVTERQEIEAILKKVLVALKEELLIDERVINISISVGVTVYPQDAEDLTQLLRYADLAMYAAKGRLGTEYAFYDETLKKDMLGRIQMENYLKSALAYDEMYVAYQPIVSLPSQQISGFEALVRWRHPDWGNVSPDQFIPVAEKTGFIIPLGLFVLEEAIKFIQEINKNRRYKLTVAVNISAIQLMHVHFEASIQKLLNKYDVPAKVIKLEITESIALEQDSGVSQRLQSLKSLGVGISLDDFGSGHSSINNLLNLPLSTLKIDKQLVQRMVTDNHVRAMVVAVLSYCNDTHIDTVAEGVETKEQLKSLLNMGFDAIQGYYYAKPSSPEQIDELIEDWVHEPFPGGEYL